jgi:DNA-binding GntR family transcriptional regulator
MEEGREFMDDDVHERPRLDLILLRSQPARIVRQSLSEQAAEAIKARILSLDLPPGTRLVVDALAEELGVSRTPVREGLKQLVSHGIVTYDGNTYAVTSYSRQDVEDIFLIRRALEALAAQQAAQRMPANALRELRAICEEGRRRIDEQDTEFLITVDVRFHEMIATGSGNQRLIHLLDQLREQSWLIRRWGFLPKLVEYVEAVTLEEHLAIVERLEAGDSEQSGKLMQEHLLRGEQRTLEWLGL